MEIIYLACPFRHDDPKIMKIRCASAHYVAAQLSSKGCYVFSPLTHNEVLVQLHPEISKHHWIDFDLAFLKLCHRLMILKLEGWDKSWGIQKEIEFAKKHGIVVDEMMPPDEPEYFTFIHSWAKKNFVAVAE